MLTIHTVDILQFFSLASKDSLLEGFIIKGVSYGMVVIVVNVGKVLEK